MGQVGLFNNLIPSAKIVETPVSFNAVLEYIQADEFYVSGLHYDEYIHGGTSGYCFNVNYACFGDSLEAHLECQAADV